MHRRAEPFPPLDDLSVRMPGIDAFSKFDSETPYAADCITKVENYGEMLLVLDKTPPPFVFSIYVMVTQTFRLPCKVIGIHSIPPMCDLWHTSLRH